MEHAASLTTLVYTKRAPMILQIGVTSQGSGHSENEWAASGYVNSTCIKVV